MITAVLIAKNEGKNIARWLEQMSWCDELLVIDNDSADDTSQLAQNGGAKVVCVQNDDFSVLRNSALAHASHDWLLYVDADEIVSRELQKEIQDAVTSATHVAYRLRREDRFWSTSVRNGEVREAYHKGIIRLVRKDSGSWEGAVHETFHLKNGNAPTLSTPLIHNAHTDIKDFLESVNVYSTIRAEELYRAGVATGFIDLTIRPSMKFIYTYFLLMGFRDGPAGFVYSFMMSFHSFLVRAKLYMLHAGVTQPSSKTNA